MAADHTRRQFVGVAAGTAFAAMTGSVESSASATTPRGQVQPETPRQFPRGFYWGVGTSSYQVEGAWNESSQGPWIWDTYVHKPGNIHDNDTGDVANDHYHRYKEDVSLMKSIGVTAYRLSVAWPRIFPNGTGSPNAQGMAFY